MARKETMTATQRPTFVMFGGTFNPVHLGHLGLVEGLLRRGGVERLFVLPTAQNPFKEDAPSLPAELRLQMVRAAVQGLPGVSVLDMELRRGHPSYTIDTVTALASQYPAADLQLAMGWDVFSEFLRWRSAEAILELSGLWVVLREGFEGPASGDSGAWLAGLPERWRGRLGLDDRGSARDGAGRVVVEFINLALPEISATQIRSERSLEWVPEKARALLAAHWRKAGHRGEA